MTVQTEPTFIPFEGIVTVSCITLLTVYYLVAIVVTWYRKYKKYYD